MADIDWSKTTWEGSRREQIERWSRLSFDEVLEAQEELADLAREMSDLGSRARTGQSPATPPTDHPPGSSRGKRS